MDPDLIGAMIQLGLPVVLLFGAYVFGNMSEKAHYRHLRRRERASRNFPAVTFKSIPPAWNVVNAELVTGNVVISIDHFKRFLAGLRGIFGGRVKSYESLLDRGRREAIMRVKEEARRRGAHAVINIRLESARIASSRRKGKGTTGIEVLAFGTALKLAK